MWLLRSVAAGAAARRAPTRAPHAPRGAQERFYFGDTVLPLFESGIPLVRERLQRLPDAGNVTIAYPDEGAWKRFHYQFGDYPEARPGCERCGAARTQAAACGPAWHAWRPGRAATLSSLGGAGGLCCPPGRWMLSPALEFREVGLMCLWSQLGDSQPQPPCSLQRLRRSRHCESHRRRRRRRGGSSGETYALPGHRAGPLGSAV